MEAPICGGSVAYAPFGGYTIGRSYESDMGEKSPVSIGARQSAKSGFTRGIVSAQAYVPRQQDRNRERRDAPTRL